MKKLIGIALVLALAVMLMPGAVFADDPATVTIDWGDGTVTAPGSGWTGGYGTGWINVGVNTGDASAGFTTGGDSIRGSYTATDSNNNPYSYGVDNFSSYLNAGVANGYINTGCNRDSSYAGMYGNAGQSSYSFVQAYGGTASMAYRSTTNFAGMVDGSYKYQLPGGHNIVADASSYFMNRSINDGRGNLASTNAAGSGTATLDCMSAEASGRWTLQLGTGAGCYKDANFNATGTGVFTAHVEGNTSTTSAYGTTNVAQTHTMFWSGGSCSIPDTSMQAY